MFRAKLDNDDVALGDVASRMLGVFGSGSSPAIGSPPRALPYDLDRARIVYRHR